MARKKGGLTGWIRHRRLVEAEAVLLVGAGQELLERFIAQLVMTNWAKTLWTMATTAGILGGVLLLVLHLTRHSVTKTHQTVQSIPFPTPLLLIHLAAFVGLFVLYAWVWDFWPVLGQRTLLR